jgi:hypothetical protein
MFNLKHYRKIKDFWKKDSKCKNYGIKKGSHYEMASCTNI